MLLLPVVVPPVFMRRKRSYALFSFSNSICARECSPFSLFSERSGWPTNVWSLIAHSSVGGLDFFRFEAIPLSHASPYGLPIFRFPPATPSGLL